MGLREKFGGVLGVPLAIPVWVGSRLRRARLFHPRGVVYRSELTPCSAPLPRPFKRLCEALSGTALVRASAAMSKTERDHFEVLGMALRIGWKPVDGAERKSSHQDLLFATIRSPFTMPFSPFTTKAGDYLSNFYYAVAPFHARGFGNLKLRLRPSEPGKAGSTRADRLERMVSRNRAVFQMEARRTFWRTRWTPVAELRLVEKADVDQVSLGFRPFQTGRGIVPVGVVHSLRRATYRASQNARQRAG